MSDIDNWGRSTAELQPQPIRQQFSLLTLRCIAWLALACVASTHAKAADLVELDPRVAAAEQQRIAAVARAMPPTVSIFVPGGGGGGSGVLISPDGYALTNFHVSSPAGSYMRCGLSDGRIYDAVIIGVDPVGDLALIRLLGRNDFPFAEFADSLKARVGQWCMVIGNPFLLNTNLKPSVSWGILSGVGRYQYPAGTLLEYADCFQTDATINPGNSGGPLFNAQGQLLGIVGRGSFEKRGRVNVGVGYAISIHQARNFLGDLHSGRVVDHATLGATVATADDGTVKISNILDTSDAYRRGLRYDDEIIEIDGRSVHTANQVQNVLATLPAQWRVKVSYRHEGELRSTLVRLASVHREDELLEKMAAALPPPPPAPDQPKSPDQTPSPDAPKNSKEPDEPKKPEAPSDTPETPDKPSEPGDAPEKATESMAADGEKVPQQVLDIYEARRGYANYFVNRQKQQAFLEMLKQQLPFKEAKQPGWVIAGQTRGDDPQPVTMRIDDGSFELRIGEKTIEAKTQAELYSGITSRNASGVLACLDAWRRMLRDGVEQFGDCYYRGTAPLLGERPLRHWMVGSYGALEASWLYHPETNRLEAIEVYADREDEPVELLLEWGTEPNTAPKAFSIRYGTDETLSVSIESWTEAEAIEGAANE